LALQQEVGSKVRFAYSLELVGYSQAKLRIGKGIQFSYQLGFD